MLSYFHVPLPRVFGCAAQQVLLYVCLCFCLCVWFTVWSTRKSTFLCTSFYIQHPECSRMFQNACRIFQNVPECMKNVPKCMQNFKKCSRKFKTVPECMHEVPWAKMKFQELVCSFMSMSMYAVPFFVWAAYKNFAVLVLLLCWSKTKMKPFF